MAASAASVRTTFVSRLSPSWLSRMPLVAAAVPPLALRTDRQLEHQPRVQYGRAGLVVDVSGIQGQFGIRQQPRRDQLGPGGLDLVLADLQQRMVRDRVLQHSGNRGCRDHVVGRRGRPGNGRPGNGRTGNGRPSNGRPGNRDDRRGLSHGPVRTGRAGRHERDRMVRREGRYGRIARHTGHTTSGEIASGTTRGDSACAVEGEPAGAASVAGGGTRSLASSGCSDAQDANSSEQQTARTRKHVPDDWKSRPAGLQG